MFLSRVLRKLIEIHTATTYIYNCHFSIIFSRQSLSKRFHFQKPCFAPIQVVSYTTSASFPENVFVRTLKLSFILNVETYNEPELCEF
jgi:hypothetical protein